MHLNWVFPVACSLLPASFEEFRRPNLNAEQLTPTYVTRQADFDLLRMYSRYVRSGFGGQSIQFIPQQYWENNR